MNMTRIESPEIKAKQLYDKLNTTTSVRACIKIMMDELINETGSKYWYSVRTELDKLMDIDNNKFTTYDR